MPFRWMFRISLLLVAFGLGFILGVYLFQPRYRLVSPDDISLIVSKAPLCPARPVCLQPSCEENCVWVDGKPYALRITDLVVINNAPYTNLLGVWRWSR